MRFTATLEHRTFFSKNRYIEFDELLSSEQVALLQKELDTTLIERLKKPLNSSTSLEMFQMGYDMWRTNDTVKKYVFKNTFSQIAAVLLKSHLLRIAYDQYITPAGQEAPLTEILSLSQLSCIKPLAGACLIRLSDEPVLNGIDQSQCPIPSKAGHVIFLSPDFLIHWDQLFALEHLKCLLIAYAPKQAIYHLEKKDPHTHTLKRAGYVFGDSLNDNLSPVIYRD